MPTTPKAATITTGTPEHHRTSGRNFIRRALTRYGLCVLFLLVFALFSTLPMTSGNFFSISNFQSLAADQAVIAVLAFAAVIPLIVGEFDFSLGLGLELSALFTAGVFVHHHWPLWLALLLGVFVGAVMGLINGFLVSVVGLNSFITTLGISTVAAGISQYYSEGSSTIVDNTFLTDIGSTSSQWLGIPRIVFVVAVLALALWFVLGRTVFGRSLYATGSNRSAAHLVGLPTRRLVMLAFVLGGALAGAAGLLYLARQGSASPTIGNGYILPAYAAAFLSTAAFQPGRFNINGVVVAVLFVAIGSVGLLFAGLPPWVQQVFQGGALVIALISTAIVRRKGR